MDLFGFDSKAEQFCEMSNSPRRSFLSWNLLGMANALDGSEEFSTPSFPQVEVWMRHASLYNLVEENESPLHVDALSRAIEQERNFEGSSLLGDDSNFEYQETLAEGSEILEFLLFVHFAPLFYLRRKKNFEAHDSSYKFIDDRQFHERFMEISRWADNLESSQPEIWSYFKKSAFYLQNEWSSTLALVGLITGIQYKNVRLSSSFEVRPDQLASLPSWLLKLNSQIADMYEVE